MRRREFITLIGSAAVAWPLAVRAQATKLPTVGFLNGSSPDGFATALAGFRRGLNDVGYAEGRDVFIEYRWAEGQYDRLPSMAISCAATSLSFLRAVAISELSLQRRQRRPYQLSSSPPSTRSSPGLSAVSIGNVTGATLLFYRVEAKRLELLRQLVPNAGIIGVLVNRTNPTTDANERSLRAAADALGLQIDIVSANNKDEIDRAFATFAQRRTGALFIMGDPFLNGRYDQLSALAARYAIPAIFNAREFPAAGGLISYGANFADVYREAGIYTGRILKGAKPEDLPVLQPTKFELLINHKTAKALGLAIPPMLLALADEVIE